LATLEYCIAPTSSYKRCQQPQNFTRHNKNLNDLNHGGKIICNNTKLNPCFVNKSFTCKGMALLDAFVVS
jgi:hypothetical protein